MDITQIVTIISLILITGVVVVCRRDQFCAAPGAVGPLDAVEDDCREFAVTGDGIELFVQLNADQLAQVVGDAARFGQRASELLGLVPGAGEPAPAAASGG